MFESEKVYFSIIERIYGKKVDEIELTDSQERKLRYFTKKISSLNPEELNSFLR